MSPTLTLTLTGIPSGGIEEDIVITLQANDFGKTGIVITKQITNSLLLKSILTVVDTDYTISPLEVTFPATESPSGTSMSEDITVTAVMDNLFEEDESFEVSVTAISSNYVSCADGRCNPQISITQNPSDGRSFRLNNAINLICGIQ